MNGPIIHALGEVVREPVITRAQFVAAVESLLGTPVRHKGRVAGRGVDCVGVPLVALALLGIVVPEPESYSRLPGEDQLAAGLARYCDPIGLDVAQPGDLLQVFVGSQARHVHVVTGKNECGQLLTVHAWGRGDRVQRAIPERIRAAWRVRGLA
ncbi:MAG: hypothetical protein WAT39_07060 [Planctomycetota bacterium]